MSTVTPVTVVPNKGDGAQDTELNIGVGEVQADTRILGHLRLEQILQQSTGWTLFLADDEKCLELTLVVLATSEAALSECLSGPAAGVIVQRTVAGSQHVAQVALDECHLERFGERLLAGHPSTTHSTLLSANAPAENLLADGSVFADRYRVDGVLGRGGMGEVYRAYDDTFQRAVALKVVRLDRCAEAPNHRDEAKRRLLNEARVVSMLRHPHIVEIYDAGESNGVPYLVLELCDGGNLRKAMAEDTSQAERLRWLTEIAEALAHAHAQGIIHRDVKPENVILTKEGRAKVADFGIAKALKRDHGNNTVFGIVGTPRYMAPEQLLGGAVDARADQYAWGLVAHEVLTKSHPRVRNVDSGTADDAATVMPRVPENWRRVLARATGNEPAARYADFRALLADLGPTRRRRLWPVLVGIAAVVGGTSILFAAHPSVQHRGPPSRPPINEAPLSFDVEKVDAETVSRCATPARHPFAAGLQLWRDASQWEAVPKFEEATKVDPDCAAASVYYLLAATHTYPRRREHFRHAREYRVNLNERERGLLDALEPWLADPPNIEEARRRAASMSERMPMDHDARRLHARALRRLNRYDEALVIVNETAALHAGPIPGNEFEAAHLQVRLHRPAAALDRFSRCLQASPDSADCRLWKGILFASQGQCVEAETELRQLVSVMPQSQRAQFELANVLLTSTNDAAAARPIFEERWRLYSADGLNFNPTRETAQLADEYRMAMLSGQLEKALGLVRKWNDEVSNTNNGRYRGDPLLELIELLRELGYKSEARELARKGLRESRGWTGDESLDVGIELARAAYVTGGLDAKEYRGIRDEWLNRRHRPPVEAWLTGFAGLPDVGADMAPPIASGEYAQDWFSMSPERFVRAATELDRVGRTGDAIQHADAAAKWCLAYSGTSYIHAQLAAAQAHDGARDTLNACERYADLRNLLAKSPRSNTYQIVVRRMNQLSCEQVLRTRANR